MLCSCGVELKRRSDSPRHLSGALHLHGKRLLALKNRSCLTLEEMGSLTGITRERVRQILVKLDRNYNGPERHQVCTIKKRHAVNLKLLEELDEFDLLRKFRQKCRDRGLDFLPLQNLYTKGFNSCLVMVGKYKCSVKAECWTEKVSPCRVVRYENPSGYFRILGLRGRAREGVDFIVQCAGSFGWFIIPLKELTGPNTMMILGREPYDIGFKGSVDIDNFRKARGHKDWLQYLNRWDFLGEN